MLLVVMVVRVVVRVVQAPGLWLPVCGWGLRGGCLGDSLCLGRPPSASARPSSFLD